MFMVHSRGIEAIVNSQATPQVHNANSHKDQFLWPPPSGGGHIIQPGIAVQQLTTVDEWRCI